MAKKDMEIEMEAMPVDNVGIMQGFLEMMNEDDDEFEEDDEYEAGEMLGRTPDSPEILMNNLRGDMRSIDARRDELADLVGYSAAAETPESVLAMLQPVLAQQGIGAMMPPGPMPPGGISPVGAPNVPNVPNVPNMPSDMMAPMQPMPAGGIGDMAPGAMPPGPPPLQMARGGVVQRFSQGNLVQKANFDSGGGDDADASDENDASSILGYSSSTLPASRSLVESIMARQPGRISDLAQLAGQKTRAYEQLLGGNQGDLAKLGFLTSLGERGFAYAANVDPITGQPLRGSALSRFAGAARGLPAEMMKMAAAKRKEDQALKLAGLKSAEETIVAERAANQKLLELKTDIAKEEIKAAGKGGKVTGTPFNQYQELITSWVQGTLDPAGQTRILNAVTQMVQPTMVTVTDKFNNVTTEVRRADIPRSFVDGLVRNYGKEAADKWIQSLGPGIKVSSLAFPTVKVAEGAAAPSVEPTTGEDITGGVAVETTEPAPKTPEGAQLVAGSYLLPSTDPSKPKLWSTRGYLAGPLNTAEAFITSNVPGMPPNVVDKVRKDAIKANEGLISALATNEGRVSVDEMQRLRPIIGLTPRVFGGEGAMSTALVSLDDALLKEKENYSKIIEQPDKHLARTIDEARVKVNLIDTYRQSLGVPPSIMSSEQLKGSGLRAGEEYVDKRDPNKFSIGRKDTFSYRDEAAIKSFQQKNPGGEFAVILPSGKIKRYRAPGKTQ
jgi:hypothetical protein